jgi:catechol 2,3-dioxygenase-like lactoylglutathione lyase family enzyme
MFDSRKMFATVAVDNVEKARQFYGQTLGLPVEDGDQPGLIQIRGNGGQPPVVIYPKPFHEPANFTVLNFPVDDVGVAVDELTAAGIRMEHYDRDDIKTDKKGIMHGDGMAIAWFRDPAGNILSVVSEGKS